MIIDAQTKEIPQFKSFFLDAESYIFVIDNARPPLHEFLHKVSICLSNLYASASNLLEISIQMECSDPPSKFGKMENKLHEIIGKYNFYNICLDQMDINNPNPATGSLADDLAEIYADLIKHFEYYKSSDLAQIESALWEWKFGFENHWGEHLVNALKHIHYLLFYERIQYSDEEPNGV